MNDISEIDNEKRDKLRERARSLVYFKNHLIIFILANIFIWIVWFFWYYIINKEIKLWAAFPTLIWFIIIIFHYLWVYKWTATQFEKKYNKLVKQMTKEKENIDEN